MSKYFDKKIKITLIKSVIGVNPKHKLCVRALGLRKLNSSSFVVITPQNMGLIKKVSYLLKTQAVS